MKYAIVSDLHANESAFRHVLEDARLCGATEIVCLGDVVGYGPLPAETVALARQNCRVVLAGNHDDAVSGRADAADFVDLAGDAVQRHREALGSDDLAWLKTLPYTAKLEGGAIAAHGDLVDPPKFYYVDDDEGAVQNFNAADSQLVFVGHTHVPCVYLTGHSGTVYRIDPQDFTLEPGKRYIVNPGSVGYPREANGQCYSSYVLYDSDEQTVTYRFLPFSVASVMQRGKGLRAVSKKLVAALVLGVAAAVATAVFLLTPKVEVSDDPALVVETRTLELDAAKKVKANLMLANGSSPVQLKIEFRDADGNPAGLETLTVKKSSAREFKVPANAVNAEFTVLKATRDETPAVALFAPTAK